MFTEDHTYNKRLLEEFTWMPEKGMGYFPVKDEEMHYDADYIKHYDAIANTDQGVAINNQRVALIRKYMFDYNTKIIDIGVGSGNFYKKLMKHESYVVKGYDINPYAVDMLKADEAFEDPYLKKNTYEVMCFWDAIEHIPNPKELLDKCTGVVYATIPIFTDGEHVRRSKHFKKTEHIWYWTPRGFVEWMGQYGFGLVEYNNNEELLGREDVGTFVFIRI